MKRADNQNVYRRSWLQEVIMKSLKLFIILLPLIMGLLLIFSIHAEQQDDIARVTFAVQWYDVGAAALEGRPGILVVERGWQGHFEVNRVDYDPTKVSIGQMEGWLKEVGTYIKTIPGATKPEF